MLASELLNLAGRISLEMDCFCSILDTKCLRTFSLNKDLLRNEEAALPTEAMLQHTPFTHQCLPLQAMAAAVDWRGFTRHCTVDNVFRKR
jgi:hypothetical protein